MLPEFSVVISTYQQPALLLKCLDALGRQRLSHSQFEIIVVDEGNSPETATAVSLFARQIARDSVPIDVRYLTQPEKPGTAAGRNEGWKAARGQYIAFTDDDCLPEPNWLSSAMACFEQGAQVVSGQVQVLLPDQPTSFDSTATFLKEAEFVTSNCFCQKLTLERIGGFDETIDADGRENSDLRFKCQKVGIPISKCSEAVVVYPIRPYPSNGLMTGKQEARYDSLLHKRHPYLFKKNIPVYRWQLFSYYTSLISLLIGLIGLVSGQANLLITGVSIWSIVLVDLIMHRLPSAPLTWSILRHTIASSAAVPFSSIYWRLYGAIKYRLLY